MMERKKLRIIIGVVAAILLIAVVAIVSAVFMGEKVAENARNVSENTQEKEEVEDTKEPVAQEEINEEDSSLSYETKAKALSRPVLLSKVDESELDNIKANVEEFTLNSDLSNAINGEDYKWYDEEFKNKLASNQFVVVDNGANEFFETYEMNRYLQIPSFVTVDSMMHSYHLYFAHLLKSIEKKVLIQKVTELSQTMLEESIKQFEELRGSDWENAAKRNVAFFGVGNSLLTGSVSLPKDIDKIVEEELSLIANGDGIDVSPLLGDYEDYSQYIPRGYYEGDENLEKYFKTMMWYGRIQFREESEDMDKSALLMTLALNGDAFDNWEGIYAITSFFAGASDDLGYYDYIVAINEVYGDKISLKNLSNDEDKWNEFHKKTSQMRAPRINSIPIEDGDENIILGYRFMGQRFTIDATIMQELIYSKVYEDSEGKRRMLPDALDVPAALGSQKALDILEEGGNLDYKNYSQNMDKLKEEFSDEDSDLWKASLYAGWLNTLRPLLIEKAEGYPGFMTNEEWTKKTLETFTGSYTELKHDTVLYSKQVMAEMGGGWDEYIDDRGYVEPEPKVYARFSSLAEDTIEGLKAYGYLSSEDEDNLNKLSSLAKELELISVKELKQENLTDEEYDLIREYGGQLEHIWLEVIKDETDEEYPQSDEFPAAIVVDVATDPNGTVLELGTGRPATIYVAVLIDGKIRICEGSVYSFYQFEQPIDDRLTDSKWRRMLGVEIADYQDPLKDMVKVEHPEWVMSYRYESSFMSWD